MPHNISYTHIASILLKEINRIRNDPALLLPILEERKEKYDEDGNYYPLSGLNFSVKTKEGKQGVVNLIEYVKKQRESPSLEWSYELHQAADKRCHFLSSSEEQNVLNRVANLQIGELVSEFTTWRGQLVELTFYGFIQPKEYICELLLEDGRDTKENRVEFFNRMACYIGIGINTHEKYRFVIVLIMANQVATHEPIASLKNIREDSIRESSFNNNRVARQNSRGGKMNQSGTGMNKSGTGMNKSGTGSNNVRERKSSGVNVNIEYSSRSGEPLERAEEIDGSRRGQQYQENPRVSAHQPYFQAPLHSPGEFQGENDQEHLECRIEDCVIY